MKIAVYDCVTPDALTAKYGPTGGVVSRWVAPFLPEAIFTTHHLPGGEPPVRPGETDGIVISGSEKGVYDDTPWMDPLRENILAHRDHGTPIYGICFGHQIMADVLGGRAEKADKGFAAGVRKFEVDGAETPAYVAHQDQVVEVPPGATVTASAPYCPVAALDYDFPAQSVQFHPEYDKEFAADLIEMFGDKLMSEDELAAARATMGANVSDLEFGKKMAAFFRAHIAG